MISLVYSSAFVEGYATIFNLIATYRLDLLFNAYILNVIPVLTCGRFSFANVCLLLYHSLCFKQAPLTISSI